MFGCNKSSVSDSISLKQSEQTEVRKIINKIKNKSVKNERLKFLILLNEEDYKKYLYIFPSKKDRLKNQKSNFPGELIIEKYEHIDSLEYNIENNPVQNQIYIMLPKEKLYINSENFTSRYIDSKLEELKNIFMLLKAKSVKITKNLKTSSKENVEISGGLNINNININETINFENSTDNDNKISNEMIFLNNSSEIDLNKLEIDNYYYLRNQHDWQNIIIRRIEGNLSIDKYIYHNKEMKLFKAKFINKLKFLELSVDYDWEKLKDLKIEYEIEYYPLDKDESSLDEYYDLESISTIS